MNKSILALFVIVGILMTGAATISAFGSGNIMPNNDGFYHHGGHRYHDSEYEDFHHHSQFDDSATYEALYLHLNEEDRELVDSEYSLRIRAIDFSELDETKTNEAIQSVKEEMVAFIDTNIFDENTEDYSYRQRCH